MLSIRFSKTKRNPEIEFFLNQVDQLRRFDELELSISVYPYQRQVKADDFHFDPYEDYVADLVEGQRSTYQAIHSVAPQIFGLLLGGAILSYFMLFYPQLLISVESFVSIFAAYTVGKEIWSDLDTFLQDRTKSWRVRWVQQSFYYVLQQFGTFQRFWQLARLKRYGYQLTLPAEIDFISHSNSKTIEMLFQTKHFPSTHNHTLRVLRGVFDSQAHPEVMPEKSLIICRLATIKRFWFIKIVTENYQAYDQGKVGTLDMNNVWQAQQSLQKKYIAVGRLVWFINAAEVVHQSIIGE